MDLVNGIVRYEKGEMSVGETVELFQHLVNTGMAWELQGHYGRTARTLIDHGLVTVEREESDDPQVSWANSLEPVPYPDYEGSYLMEELPRAKK